jgi:hypothetical protein
MASDATSSSTQAATSVDVSDSLSVGALVAIIVCIAFVLSLMICATYFFRLYFFYRSPIVSRPKTLFTSAEAGCCTSMCVSINIPILSCCFPSLRDSINDSFLFDHNAQEISVVNRTVGIFQPVFHHNPMHHVHPHMHLNHEKHMLIPASNTHHV